MTTSQFTGTGDTYQEPDELNTGVRSVDDALEWERERLVTQARARRIGWESEDYPDDTTTAYMTWLVRQGIPSTEGSEPSRSPEASDNPLTLVTTTYISNVEHYPWVRRVIISGSDDDAVITTVISAPPFDFTYREPLFAAELAALESSTDVAPEFLLVNDLETLVDEDGLDGAILLER